MTWRASRTDAVLVLVAAILVAVWLAIPNGASEDPLAMTDWSDLAEGANGTLVVRRGSEQTAVRIERDSATGRRYVVQGHSLADADPAAVDRLVNALGHLQALRAVDGAKTQFGLDRPSLELSLTTDLHRRQLKLGAAAPSPSGARYAEVVSNQQHVLVVLAASSAQALDIEPQSLLEHRVLDWVPSDLRRIETADGLGPLVLERAPDGHWQNLNSYRARASRSVMDSLLLGLTELALNQFLEPAAATKALHGSKVSQLLLQAKRDERVEELRLKFGPECPGRPGSTVLLVEGARTRAGCVDNASLPKLTLDRAALDDKTAFSFHVDEIERLEVTAAGKLWTLARKEAAFQLTTTKDTSVTLAAGNSMLTGLGKLRGDRLSRWDCSQFAWDMSLTLHSFVFGHGERSQENVKVGPLTSDGTRWLCRDDDMELILSAENAHLVEVDPAMLRDPELLALPIDAITEIRIESPAGRQLLRSNAQGQWSLVEPKTQHADLAAIETLREHLAMLRAERWLPPSRLDAAKVRARNASVEFSVADDRDAATPTKPTHHRLALSLDESLPTVGWFDADPAPFQLESALAELLDGLLIDRSLLQLSDAERTLKLSRGPDHMELQRRDSHWEFVSGAPARFDPTALVSTLEHLRAIAVYGSLLRAPRPSTAAADESPLIIEYARANPSHEGPRLRFELGARFKRRGQWVRYATVAESRLTFILRDEDAGPLVSAFRALP